MKKMLGVMVIGVSLMLMLAACGEKTQEDVTEELESKVESMDGYKAKADMTMNTGKDEQEYHIDVWHKKDDFYRVELSNGQDDEEGHQIILKNEDGVFVLSPELNKSFKFQEEWPENGSQPYLYQSLVNDILKDNEADFNKNEDSYVFETKTNYQSNNNLPYQEVSFDSDAYTPEQVKVLDKDRNPLVEVEFTEFDMEPSFEEGDFERDKYMSGGEEDVTASTSQDDETLSVLYPKNMAGSELVNKEEKDTENGERIIMTFEGEKDFTLIEEKETETNANMSKPEMINGEIINLGHSVGALAENKVEWTYNGVNFVLASEDLTRQEMIDVAKSVKAKDAK